MNTATKDLLAWICVWTGVSIGALKLIDWSLSTKQKQWLSDRATNVWYWLSEQKAGRFIGAVRHRRVQLGFVLFAHASMLLIILLFLGRVHLGWNVNVGLQIGHPRLYLWQVWVDVAAIILSAFLVGRFVHPRLAQWMSTPISVGAYFKRSLLAWLGCIGCVVVLVGVETVLIFSMTNEVDVFDEQAVRRVYEHKLGGVFGIAATHATVALIAAPLMVETLIVQTILFMSVYWLLFVILTMLLIRSFQFVLARVVESKEGPVLGLSGALVAIGMIAKAVTG